MTPLDVIDTNVPQLSDVEAALLVQEEYGLDGQLRSLVSERDQNFRLTANDGNCYVLKIAGAAENQITADFQIQALLHLEARGCKAKVPKIHRTRDGASSTTVLRGETRHVVRLVSYLHGQLLSDVSSTPELMRSLGTSLAYLDIALSDFNHEGDEPLLRWDMQRASDLVPLTMHIPDAALRQTARACFDDFQQIAEPQFASLRHQVIHNDINPGNVLVEENDAESVAGIIDFSDLLRAPLVIELGITASYLRRDDADAFADIASFIAAYNRVAPLEDVEIDLLYDLVRTRLVTTVTMLYWRLATQGHDDEYARKSLLSESSAERFLARISAVSRKGFSDRMRQECGH